jgi:hypothetical protein
MCHGHNAYRHDGLTKSVYFTHKFPNFSRIICHEFNVVAREKGANQSKRLEGQYFTKPV